MQTADRTIGKVRAEAATRHHGESVSHTDIVDGDVDCVAPRKPRSRRCSEASAMEALACRRFGIACLVQPWSGCWPTGRPRMLRWPGPLTRPTAALSFGVTGSFSCQATPGRTSPRLDEVHGMWNDSPGSATFEVPHDRADSHIPAALRKGPSPTVGAWGKPRRPPRRQSRWKWTPSCRLGERRRFSEIRIYFWRPG